MSIPKTLTADQCRALLDELLANQGTQNQELKCVRNYAMACVMLETGIRVGELCGLRVDDLWFAGFPVESLVIRGEIAKNKQERHIPISKALRKTVIMIDSLVWCPCHHSAIDFAFASGPNANALTTRTVERIILSAGRQACHLEVTPHMLRHTFASRMMRKTNSRVVQALLGHSSLQSTQIYMHPNSEDLKNAINA